MGTFKIASNDLQFIRRELWARLHKKSIANYLIGDDNPEVSHIGRYIKNNGVRVFPYDFADKYNINDVEVAFDKKCGLFYTMYAGKKLYLKRKYKSEFRAKRYIKNLMMEQDIRSPHRYLTSSFYPHKDTVVLDIGGAEGFFSLDYINDVKKIYIFECDEEWIEALQYTYKDYMDKVVIIKKFVCDYSDETHITIDDFIEANHLLNESLFIKMDAEGNEDKIIEGAGVIHDMKVPVSLAVCTYHLQDAEQLIRDKFKHWFIENSDGYMVYYYDYAISKPYIRRGVLRIRNEQGK